ncbi:DUF3800 domain-containing protein [Corynebacterium variabile]|uniref:DUF3800 domain-containing protein n=1 Tax=Corynebacterium variabile TaxID=1727 RepID=UPI003BAF0123
MLLAYIDEIGESGAFCGRDHGRYNTSPSFGYAGFVIPENYARRFGAIFTKEKNTLFKTELLEAEHRGRWEKKGASMFRPTTNTERPQHIRVFNSLVQTLRSFGGNLFYYSDEKPLGTPKQTNLLPDGYMERETCAMQETLNRLARHAKNNNHHILVLMDQINEKSRKSRLPKMYQHILGRASEHEEMKTIIEPPMHVDSRLSSNIQFADWTAAYITRAIDFQLISDSRYAWVTDSKNHRSIRGSFTYDSKLHLWQRDLSDINNSQILDKYRVVHPVPNGNLISNGDNLRKLQIVKAAAEKAHLGK